MKTSFLVKCVLLGASLPLLAGCVERVVYRDQPPPGAVVDNIPPPPPLRMDVEPPPPGPMATWYWAPGVWEWHGRWLWTGGHWVNRPYPGAVWVAPHWRWRGQHRVWVAGSWR